jgi:hypothetical protein
MRFNFRGQKYFLSIFIFQPISDKQNFENFSEKINLNEFSKSFLPNGHFYLFLTMSFPVNAIYRVAVYTTKSWHRR